MGGIKALLGVLFLLALGACAYDTSQILWQKQLGSSPSSLAYGGGLIYAGLEDGRVIAFNPQGKVEWSYSAEHIVKSLASSDGFVYAASMDGFMHAINKSGVVNWVVKTPTYVSHGKAFVVSDGVVYAGLADGFLHAYDDGGRLVWTVKSDAYVQSLLVTRSSVVVVSDRRVIYYAKDGQKLREVEFPSYIRVAEASGSRVAVGLGNNQFMVYDLDGVLLVNRTLESQIGAVSADEKMGYSGVRDNLLRAFSLNGSIMWSLNLNNSIVAVSSGNGLVAAATLDNRIYLLDSGGSILKVVEFGGVPERMVFMDKNLLVGTSAGDIAVVILPERKEANATLLIFFVSLAVILSVVLLINSWRSPV